MLAAAVAAIAHVVSGHDWLHWLALHLLFLGGISQLVLGAGQFFVCAFLATSPPPRRLIWAQLAAWNAGTLLVAVGVPTATSGLVDGGGALIAAGLVLFALGLRGMEQRSLQHAPWALRWYQASAACLGAGALLGVLMADGTPWPRHHSACRRASRRQHPRLDVDLRRHPLRHRPDLRECQAGRG